MMIENLTQVGENSKMGVENNISASAAIKCGNSQLECDVRTEYCSELYNNCSSCAELCPMSGISHPEELCKRLCPVWMKEAMGGSGSDLLEEVLSDGAITAIICAGLVLIFCSVLITWTMYIHKLDIERQKELELKCKKLKYKRLCIDPDESKSKSTKVQMDLTNNKVSPNDNQKKHSSERHHIHPIDSQISQTPLLDTIMEENGEETEPAPNLD